MSFAHEDREFPELLRIVARETGLSPALVEKDYWVTHTLWALHRRGHDVWFKGGTSLSKGFGLIQRFSEDLDLKIERGADETLPKVPSWTSVGTKAAASRRSFFGRLEKAIVVPGAKVELDRAKLAADERVRGAEYRVVYGGAFLGELGPRFRPFVLLEVGSARVTPFVPRALSSFVHDALDRRGQLGDYDDNRPREVRCAHPLVTLLEKLDAIAKRFARDELRPEEFVRHYEDAARIARAAEKLPSLERSPAQLAEDMVAKKQIKALPTADDAAFTLRDRTRRQALARAHEEIAPMFWGERLSIGEACRSIRAWIKRAKL